MKKHIFTLLALALTGIAVHANPVGQETARQLGQTFVSANFEFTRQSSDLSLAYTSFSDRGEACYYIFNVGTTGFVIIAGDDHYRPVIGYSEEGIFDPDDMAPALVDYLEGVRQGVMEAAVAPAAQPAVAADWAMLEKTGRMVSRHGGREDEYLVETKWNQNYPYNYFCPEGAGGPGGHCYAGCVATAAAQLMRYWSHPIQGQGSHTYYPEDHPEYGPLTANFGETTYDWANMPNSISSSSPIEQIEAVALLIYHAGVSVDMNYRPSSSGAVTGLLCQTMPAYFFYTDQMANLYREEYTHEGYMQLIIKAIDMNWPMVHRGGGHAYVLDGYNDNDMVHLNWGWSGSSDGWFNIDEHGYTEGESVIYTYVPAEIYAATPNMPTDLNVVASTDGTLTAALTWKNPMITLTNQNLAVIDQIVVERNGQVVYTEDNPTPGAEMSIVDETVPYYDVFDYAVYAVVNGQRGASAVAEKVLVSPTCNWKIIMQSSAFQGWNGGYVILYSGTGKEICRLTTTNSSPQSVEFAVPVGQVSFGWSRPRNNVNNVTIIIKDSENNTMYTYQGNTSGLTEGIILEANNGCGNEMNVQAPYNLRAATEAGDATLTWEMSGDEPEYGYLVYRDDQRIAMVIGGESRMYVDEDLTAGHCYTVTALGLGGETEHSNETCASAGDCMGASDFDYEYVGENYKIKLSWTRPEVSAGLSGYYLYRKFGEEGTYEKIKQLGASATVYTDNTANVQGDYYYRLYAYYGGIDCTSAPASLKDDPTKFYLKVYYSPTEVDENQASALKLYPNPVQQSLSLEAEGMTHMEVYDVLGQLVYQQETESNNLTLNVSDWTEGLYFVKVQTQSGWFIRRVSIVH
jgi:hypothetical protein